MRLTARQVQDIRLAAHRVLGDGARVRVFGSRVDARMFVDPKGATALFDEAH
jgi:hypothetical protein